MANFVFLSTRTRARRFISPTNAFCINLWSPDTPNNAPPQYASSLAASFPLGSIKPQSNCYRVYSSPSTRSAEVPVIRVTLGEITTVVLAISTEYWVASERTVWKVIILVKLAISRETTERWEIITLWLGISTMMKLSDFTSLNSSGSFTKTGYLFSSFNSGSFTFELLRSGRLRNIFLPISLTMRCLVFSWLQLLERALRLLMSIQEWICSSCREGRLATSSSLSGGGSSSSSSSCCMVPLEVFQLFFPVFTKSSSEIYLRSFWRCRRKFLLSDSLVVSVCLKLEITISFSSSLVSSSSYGCY